MTDGSICDCLLPELRERIRSVRLIVFDFDGVFTDNMVYVFQDGSEAVRCFRGDGIGLQKLAALGIGTVILSTETNPVVAARSRKLGIRCFQGCRDKLQVLAGIVEEMNLSMSEVAFVGNDINDLSCLNRVGLPIVVRDADSSAAAVALYKSQACGGYGAVREICDLFERVLGS